MKNYLFFLFLLTVTSSLFSQEKIDRKKIATTIYNFIKNKEYGKALALMDTSYTRRVSEERLAVMWNNVLTKGGAFKETKELVETVQPNFAVVYIPCVFEKRTTNIKFIFNKNGKVTGINFLPEELREKYQTPSYYDSTRVTESAYKVFSGEFTMPGTLSLPKNKNQTPAVILVHGSGPNDRDETVNSTKVFKDIALGLASKGIAVLRYEKRSKVFQARAIKKERTVRDETMNDVISAYKSLKNIESIDTTKIFLLGHGFGGMMLPRIAKEIPDVAGIFIVAANAGRLDDLILEQTIFLLSLDSLTERKKALLDTMKTQVNKIKNLTLAQANDTLLRLVFHAASYWFDLNQYNQVETAGEIDAPVYILHPERDYQVTMKEYNRWKQGLEQNRNVHFKLYPRLNHMLQDGTAPSLPDDYKKLGNVPLYFIDDLVGWMKQRK